MNRNARTHIIFGLFLIGFIGEATPSQVPSEGQPTIRFNHKADGNSKATVDVVGLNPADLASLATAQREPSQWRALFAVYVQSGKGESTGRPAVLGSYRVDKSVVRFEPRFPLAPGIRYRAVFNPAKLPGSAGEKRQLIVAEFALPKARVTAPTLVQQVYPSSHKLPENQLRFYLHFSAPMSQGEAYEHIRLLDGSGKPLDHPFLELDEELWDPQGKRFTLFFHPGRVKKGLKPREELGPILEAGKTYTLVIDRQWSDAGGNPLKESYRKTFQAVAARELPPDPKTWRIMSPRAGTVEPLTVRFPEPLDHALLQRLLWVSGGQNQKVAGTAAVTEEEKRWLFTPEHPWQVGGYHLVADTRLEDTAGNSITRPFEVDVFHPIERQVKAETIRLPFQVQAASSR